MNLWTARPVPPWSLMVTAVATVQILALGCTSAGSRRTERPPYKVVKPAVAFEMLWDNPSMLILDLRRQEEFFGSDGHLRGAKNIPLEELPQRIVELSGYRLETFLVYCRKEDDCGARGMEILIAGGFEDAVLIAGGIDAWIQDRFAVVKEPPPEAEPSPPPQ